MAVLRSPPIYSSDHIFHPPHTIDMQFQAQVFAPCPLLNKSCFRHGSRSNTLEFSRKPVGLMFTKNGIFGESLLVDSRGNLCQLRKKDGLAVIAAIEEGNLGVDILRKRKVVEHICLLKAKKDLSEEQEQVMLDYLYTTQYQMRGIVAISLGRISDQNPEQYSHAIFMRFQTKEDLTKFYQNPFYVGVLKEHVMPYCHGVINLDYESEVEDDILPIFRKGEEFNYGVELILLVAFMSSSLGELAEDALTSLTKLTQEFPSLIVQATKGPSLDISNTKYTHGVVIRFRSSEAFNMFINSSDYNNMWKSKFQPIIQKALYINFSVDPVGSELM
ncbi:stress-response A/B barrel domain-containing protein UP3 isoform X2 [Primulina tabacum]|uniref:stress-response A/B barrel domain-containing protein UP3 isoform X2 n=1 Tax=Primulina tabacum TaxID=48773 RepID=UPI003F5A7DC0